jgi:hypothetical protein
MMDVRIPATMEDAMVDAIRGDLSLSLLHHKSAAGIDSDDDVKLGQPSKNSLTSQQAGLRD